MTNNMNGSTFFKDLSAGVVVFLVALPLCLGIALASNAPLISGLIAGIVGGLIVSWISGSHTSVSGPAAGLTAIVFAQIEKLGSYEAFLGAVILAGVLQLVMGWLRAGSLAAFFPSSVIKGLLAAIGIILILKQIPHLFGHDPDWMGDMSFMQPDGENTFSELLATRFDIHIGATFVGLFSLLLLIFWDKTALKRIPVPAPLVVVLLGIGAVMLLEPRAEVWSIGSNHLVQVPVSNGLGGLFQSLPSPDYSKMLSTAVLLGAVTIAIVATLETLLNLEAVDKLDHQQRVSPPNRELVAQGTGNIVSGFLGGLPITSVIVRSSVNIASGGQTRLSCFIHGVFLLTTVAFFPYLLNRIPLSCLAAILIHWFQIGRSSHLQKDVACWASAIFPVRAHSHRHYRHRFADRHSHWHGHCHRLHSLRQYAASTAPGYRATCRWRAHSHQAVQPSHFLEQGILDGDP